MSEIAYDDMSECMVKNLDVPDHFSLILLDFKLILGFVFASYSNRCSLKMHRCGTARNTLPTIWSLRLHYHEFILYFKRRIETANFIGHLKKGTDRRYNYWRVLLEYKFLEQNSFQTNTIISFLIFFCGWRLKCMVRLFIDSFSFSIFIFGSFGTLERKQLFID